MASLKNGPIYALGGLDDATCYNTVERYDAKSDSWSFVKSMNLPRGGVAVAQINVSISLDVSVHHKNGKSMIRDFQFILEFSG